MCRWRSSPGPSGVSGKRARLPLPTRALPAAEMAKLRGQSDAIALRLRHHDDGVHAQRMPTRREAKDAYDALEQVRVEVIGSRFMNGVNANLRAKLSEECESEGYDRMTRKDQLPIDKALALLTRERLSGEAVPEAAQRVLNLWRDTLGEFRRPGIVRNDDGAGRPDGVCPRVAEAAGRAGSGGSRGRCRTG